MDELTGMSIVFNKAEKYFEDYEIGVNKEGTDKEKGAVWTVEPNDSKIAYLKAMNAQGKHIYVRPTFDKEDRFMFHDDVDKDGLDRHHKTKEGKWKPGRMVVESSPGNYQVWIKSDRPLSNEEKLHWLKKMDSDPGASPKHRWGRCPGFRNRKAKYRTEKGYPLAKTVWVDWKNRAHVPKVELEQEKPEIKVSTDHTNNKTYKTSELPSRDQYYKGTDKGGKVKESEQDFAYAMALYRRNVPRDVIEQRIRSERTNWENHQGEKRMSSYLKTTLDNAEKKVAQTVQHNSTRSNNKKRPRRPRKSHGDYKLTVKDIKNGNQKSMIVRDVPDKKARQHLQKYGKKAISNMGYKNTDNLELRIQRLQNQRKVRFIQKQVSVEA